MKYALLLLCLLLPSGSLAQHWHHHAADRHAVLDAEPAVWLLDSVGQPVDSYPQYAAGWDALRTLLYKYVNYPEEAFSRRVGARVEARIEIDAQGKARVIEMAREPSEMFRVRVGMAVRNMGPWVPARIGGQPVAMQARITVTFDIQQGDVDEVHSFGNLESLNQQLRSAELSSLRPVIHFYLPFSFKPYWPQGDAALQQLVTTDLPYPDKAIAKGEEGVVKTKFKITSEGEIDDLQMRSDAQTPNLEKAVRAFLKRHADWQLGCDHGITGPAYCYVNFSFNLAAQTVTVKTF